MRFRTRVASSTLFTVAVLVGAFFLTGPERVWSFFGPPDLGPVTIERFFRRVTPNDALACPPDVCKAASDVTPPEFAVSAADLRLAFAKVIAAEPRITAVASDDAEMTDRYIQRSALMHYPDTIVVKFFDLPEGRSTIALYSRSQLGKSDLGVNRTRIERWLAKLGEVAPAVQ
ncbi:MAG: DUF1499 domain-containing protein [Aestuariivirga sp.]